MNLNPLTIPYALTNFCNLLSLTCCTTYDKILLSYYVCCAWNVSETFLLLKKSDTYYELSNKSWVEINVELGLSFHLRRWKNVELGKFSQKSTRMKNPIILLEVIALNGSFDNGNLISKGTYLHSGRILSTLAKSICFYDQNSCHF